MLLPVIGMPRERVECVAGHRFGRGAWGNRAAAAYRPVGTMSDAQSAVSVPPVEDVVGEVVATLAMLAHAYLEPQGEGSGPDLESASIAIDTASAAYERIAPRLKTERHTALSAVLTDIRMAYVRKRGL
jgi:hypothetical protein